MDNPVKGEDTSPESEFATTFRYIDLYLRQKTDLFLQNYVFEPFDILAKRALFVSVLMTLLAAGTVVLVAGAVLLIATIVPLWEALLVTGGVIFVAGGIIAYLLFSNKVVLKTPKATEMTYHGKT